MKKLISILLATAMLCSLAACGNKTNKEEAPEVNIEEVNADPEALPEEGEIAEQPAEGEAEKPAETKQDKPVAKPAEELPAQKPADTQAGQPEQPVEEKPAEAPVEAPAEAPQTIGNAIHANFKATASGMTAEQLAKTVWNSVLPEEIAMVDMPVEEGYLVGFANNEITGFKSGIMFSPMIGTHPFVGYIFELESGADVSAFISDLRSKATLSWNVCTQADEMITASVGNKVLFVMCPTSFEE